MTGVLFALASALLWGSGDFVGGLATRRAAQFPVLAVSALCGMLMLAVCAWLVRESVPSPESVAWALAAGLASAIGIASLYQGLAVGNAATVAPTAAVMTAALPVLFSSVSLGLPQRSQLAGFALAVAGIWLASSAPRTDEPGGTGLKLALLAGVGFGGFLILAAQIPSDRVFGPLAVARTLTCLVALLVMVVRGLPIRMARRVVPLAAGAGLLDAAGNALYLMARQHTRLDVAAVLSSLYPVATVALARLVLREPVARLQWIGAAMCLAAVALIMA